MEFVFFQELLTLHLPDLEEGEKKTAITHFAQSLFVPQRPKYSSKVSFGIFSKKMFDNKYS